MTDTTEYVKEYETQLIVESGDVEYIVEYESGDVQAIEGDEKILVSLNSMGRYTPEDVLAKLKTVDGAGSGLDADMLDGIQPTSGTAPNQIPVRDGNGELPGNVLGTASYLRTARTINLAGDVSGSVDFDGSQDVTLDITLNDTGITPGTYEKVTVDSKGRVTSGGDLVAADVPSLDWSKITTGKPTTRAGYGITDAEPANTNIQTHIANGTLHRLIADASVSSTDLWSAEKISGELATKSNLGHQHTESDITNLDKYSQSQIDTFLSGKSNTGHGHAISDVTSLQTTLDTKAAATDMTTHTGTSNIHVKMTLSTSDASGGSDGEVWLKHEA